MMNFLEGEALVPRQLWEDEAPAEPTTDAKMHGSAGASSFSAQFERQFVRGLQ